MRYREAIAFRQALADRLRRQYPDQDVGRLQKRAVMERFLARVVVALPERARLKGGYALELRLDRARATQDVDLALRDVPHGEALEALRDAAELDLDDHLSFRVETTTRGALQGAPYGGVCLTVVPELGGPLSLRRSDGRENSRVKDLVDVVLLRHLAFADVEALRTAVGATFSRRATHAFPERISVPVRSWAAEYRTLAEDVGLEPDVATVDRAAALLDRLVERIRRSSSG